MKTTLFERQNVGTIGEHNDDDNGHGMAVMMIMTNVRNKWLQIVIIMMAVIMWSGSRPIM